jgi:RecA-family ATPase
VEVSLGGQQVENQSFHLDGAHVAAEGRVHVSARRRKPTPGPGFARLEDVVEQKIEWWWRGRMMRGAVTLLAGDGAMGKSTLAQDLAARMTRGEGPPGAAKRAPRGAILLSAEEHHGAVIRPRMRLMGADLGRVFVIDHDDDEWSGVTLPSALDRVEAECVKVRAGILIIDSGPAFLDTGLSSIAEEHIRQFMRPLARMAERLDLVVFGIDPVWLTPDG